MHITRARVRACERAYVFVSVSIYTSFNYTRKVACIIKRGDESIRAIPHGKPKTRDRGSQRPTLLSVPSLKGVSCRSSGYAREANLSTFFWGRGTLAFQLSERVTRAFDRQSRCHAGTDDNVAKTMIESKNRR